MKNPKCNYSVNSSILYGFHEVLLAGLPVVLSAWLKLAEVSEKNTSSQQELGTAGHEGVLPNKLSTHSHLISSHMSTMAVALCPQSLM